MEKNILVVSRTKNIALINVVQIFKEINMSTPDAVMRFWVFERDNFKCIYCGRSSIEHGVTLHLDHVFPKYSGGLNTFYNVVTSCGRCNFEKGSSKISKKNILRIWSKNKKLGVRTPYKYADEIIEEFEERYPTRTLDLMQYFNIKKKEFSN